MLYDWRIMALLNALRMVIIIWTYYNWYYDLNSLARQQLGFKLNFSWKGAQITGLEII